MAVVIVPRDSGLLQNTLHPLCEDGVASARGTKQKRYKGLSVAGWRAGGAEEWAVRGGRAGGGGRVGGGGEGEKSLWRRTAFKT